MKGFTKKARRQRRMRIDGQLVSIEDKKYLAWIRTQPCIVAWNKAMEADNAAKVPTFCDKHKPAVEDGQENLF